MTQVLAGDIGGTKTILALYSREEGERNPLMERIFKSHDFPGLGPMIADFLDTVDERVDLACFGVAGPVNRGRAQLTNLGWDLDARLLGRETGLEHVMLINDLVAVAQAIPFLGQEDLCTINPGSPEPDGVIAVIAPGTGLGEAFLTWDGVSYQPFASEGGHADFAPTNVLELEFLAYLQERLAHVSYEQVCSGLGIAHIYSFLKEKGYGRETDWLAEELAQASDPNPIIMTGALGTRPCRLCQQTMDIFVSILASEAANMAVNLMARGGVYLGGGIAPRILFALQERKFMEQFQNKGRMASLLAEIPVHVIVNSRAALLGAALQALKKGDGKNGKI